MGSLWTVIRCTGAFCAFLMIAGMVIAGNSANWELSGWRSNDAGRRLAWVDTVAVNLRNGSSTGADVLDVLPYGTRVTITGSSTDGFIPVEHGGEAAWIFGDYLTTSESGSSGNVAVAADVDLAEPVVQGQLRKEGDNTRNDSAASGVNSAREPTGEHWIDVDRSSATITLYVGDSRVSSFIGKIGRDPSADGFYSTAIGTFHVYSKNERLSSTPFVDNIYMTDFVGFDPDRHNGFHSPIRDASGALLPSQNPTTLGCVRLEEEAAKELFSFATIGMRVVIHE